MWGVFIIRRLMFISLGCLLLRRAPSVWMRIQNDFTEISDFTPVNLGVTKIRFWSLPVSCISPSVRDAVATPVILAVPCHESRVCCVVPNVFNC